MPCNSISTISHQLLQLFIYHNILEPTMGDCPLQQWLQELQE
jgi:hypothetical protein